MSRREKIAVFIIADDSYCVPASQVADCWGLPRNSWHRIVGKEPQTWIGMTFEGWTVYRESHDYAIHPFPLTKEQAREFRNRLLYLEKRAAR